MKKKPNNWWNRYGIVSLFFVLILLLSFASLELNRYKKKYDQTMDLYKNTFQLLVLYEDSYSYCSKSYIKCIDDRTACTYDKEWWSNVADAESKLALKYKRQLTKCKANCWLNTNKKDK